MRHHSAIQKRQLGFLPVWDEGTRKWRVWNEGTVSILHRREGGSCNLDELWGCSAKWNKPVTGGQIWPTCLQYLEQLNHGGRESSGGHQRLGKGNVGLLLQFRKMKMFWRWTVVMVGQLFECTYHYQTVHLIMVKMVNCVLCVFYQFKRRGDWAQQTPLH